MQEKSCVFMGAIPTGALFLCVLKTHFIVQQGRYYRNN